MCSIYTQLFLNRDASKFSLCSRNLTCKWPKTAHTFSLRGPNLNLMSKIKHLLCCIVKRQHYMEAKGQRSYLWEHFIQLSVFPKLSNTDALVCRTGQPPSQCASIWCVANETQKSVFLQKAPLRTGERFLFVWILCLSYLSPIRNSTLAYLRGIFSSDRNIWWANFGQPWLNGMRRLIWTDLIEAQMDHHHGWVLRSGCHSSNGH